MLRHPKYKKKKEREKERKKERKRPLIVKFD